jgi:hypothetical protein
LRAGTRAVSPHNDGCPDELGHDFQWRLGGARRTGRRRRIGDVVRRAINLEEQRSKKGGRGRVAVINGHFSKPPQLTSQKGSPRMGWLSQSARRMASSPAREIPSSGASLQMQSTTKTTPCPAASHTLLSLHHCRAFYRWRYQCMAGRARNHI